MPAHLAWPISATRQRDRLPCFPGSFYDASRRHLAAEAQICEDYVGVTEFGKGAHRALDRLVRILKDAYGPDVTSKLIFAHV